MELRKAEVSDLTYIMEILVKGRASLAAMGIDQWQGGYPHKEVIEGDIKRGESYVVINDEGALVATAMLACRDEFDYHIISDGAWLTESLDETSCYVVVHRVAVDPLSKNGGIAMQILNYAAEKARSLGCASLRVDTHPGNVPMQKVLEKDGFTRCGTICISHAEGATPERFAYEKLV